MGLEGDAVAVGVARVPVGNDVTLAVENLVRGERDEEAAVLEELPLVLLRDLMSDAGEGDLPPLVVAVDVVGLEEAGRELLLEAPRVPLGDADSLAVAEDNTRLAGRVDVADHPVAPAGANLAGEGAVRLGGQVELRLAVAEAEAAAVIARCLGNGEGGGGQDEEEGGEAGHLRRLGSVKTGEGGERVRWCGRNLGLPAAALYIVVSHTGRSVQIHL